MGGGCVVAAVDGSVEALRAAEWAAREAARHGDSLRIVSVPVMPSLMQARKGSSSTLARTPRAAATRAIRAAVSQASKIAPGLSVDADVLNGAPALAVAHAGSGASMLVLGAPGSDIDSMILGSVAKYAAANARCPVVVVHDRRAAAPGEVVAGIRDPADCDQVLSFAFEEAAIRHARLVAVHAWYWFAPPGPVCGDPVIDPGLIPTGVLGRIVDVLTMWQRRYPAVKVTGDVVRGDPGHVLSGLTAQADLVVLGQQAGGHHPGSGGGPCLIQESVLDHIHGAVAFIPA